MYTHIYGYIEREREIWITSVNIFNIIITARAGRTRGRRASIAVSGGAKRATRRGNSISRNRARAQGLPQARKLHVYGSDTFGAFW